MLFHKCPVKLLLLTCQNLSRGLVPISWLGCCWVAAAKLLTKWDQFMWPPPCSNPWRCSVHLAPVLPFDSEVTLSAGSDGRLTPYLIRTSRPYTSAATATASISLLFTLFCCYLSFVFNEKRGVAKPSLLKLFMSIYTFVQWKQK